jgi:tetratricopeptide (TPR) repeat protein
MNAYVPASVGPAAVDAFLVGRHKSHQTMFERAEPLLAAAGDLAPVGPLVLAYRAHGIRMLYGDASPLLERVVELMDGRDEDERALTDAIVAQARADYGLALDRISAFLEHHPADPYGRHKQGVFLLDLGRTDEAISALEALLEDRPNFTPALNHLGNALLAGGDSDQALMVLRRFAEAEPDNYSALDSLADALEAVGDAGAAIRELRAAVELEPAFAYGWVHLGDLHAHSGDRASADVAYRSAQANGSAYGDVFRAMVAERLASPG